MDALYLRLLNEMFSFERLKIIHLSVVIISWEAEREREIQSFFSQKGQSTAHISSPRQNKQISLKALRPFLTLHFLYIIKLKSLLVSAARKRG